MIPQDQTGAPLFQTMHSRLRGNDDIFEELDTRLVLLDSSPAGMTDKGVVSGTVAIVIKITDIFR